MPESEQPIDGQEIMWRTIVARNPRRVVDVGAGEGKWGRILRDHVPIDAIEVWQPYIEKYSLTERYDRVLHIDAREFSNWRAYDVAVLGDILEHMSKDDARTMVVNMLAAKLVLFLSIPVTDCPQDGEPFGNPYEKHVSQWSHGELIAEGWKELHRGSVPSGLATIGTYWRE